MAGPTGPFATALQYNTMRSNLKKIAVRKKYKENMEAGVDPTNFRMAA